jgi:hypothetical protein
MVSWSSLPSGKRDSYPKKPLSWAELTLLPTQRPLFQLWRRVCIDTSQYIFAVAFRLSIRQIQSMERKAQQQTLSIRISDTLREFLERSKQVISSGRGESVSTSDVAKILLESAKDDRLDFRLEVADLQQSATESLVAIRRKWDAQQDLSRAEWIFLGQYIMVACEEISEDPAMPSPDSFATLLEALLSVRRLRIDRGVALDR